MLEVFLLALQHMADTLKGEFYDLRDIAPFSVSLK